MKPSTLDLLADRVADRILARLAELMEDRAPDVTTGDDSLIDAAEVARRYGFTRSYVYEHAATLGAIRLGKGPKSRLRFDPATVYEQLAVKPAAVTSPGPRRRPKPTTDLLPIRGRR